MLPHLKFPEGEQRKFLMSVFDKSGLKTKELARIIGVVPHTVRDWKIERYNISELAVDVFSKKFNIHLLQDKEDMLNEWKKLKSEAAGKGGSVSMANMRRQGIVPGMKLFRKPFFSEELSEFVGILLGDGGITSRQVGITLNRTLDKEYKVYVIDLGERLFGDKASVIKKKDCNADVVLYSGENLVKYLCGIGLKVGNKVKQQVSVPKWIESKLSYKLACVRGLMDTDGCVVRSTHKYGFKTYTYYNPCFANRSKPLLQFVTNTLRDIGLHPCVAGERIWLYNKAETETYFNLVGSNNNRLLRYVVRRIRLSAGQKFAKL